MCIVKSLEKPFNLASLRVEIDVVDAGPRGQAGHLADLADHRDYEAGARRHEDAVHLQCEAGRRALDGRVAGEGVGGLCHADRQSVVALWRGIFGLG